MRNRHPCHIRPESPYASAKEAVLPEPLIIEKRHYYLVDKPVYVRGKEYPLFWASVGFLAGLLLAKSGKGKEKAKSSVKVKM